MDYRNYQESRDLSWKILIFQNVRSLPVRISDICLSYGINIYNYSKNAELISKLKANELKIGNDGFTTIVNGKPIIFFDDSKSPQRSRFTIAHELGHILLGHVGLYDLINREPSSEDNPIEQAANVFASRLLAPACVMWGLNVHTSEEIMRYCNLTYSAAAFRAERMEQLYSREKEFIQNRGKSCFLMSPLEKKVYQQFSDFIRENRCEEF